MNKLSLIGVIAASSIFSAHSVEMTPYIVNGHDVSVTTYPSIANLFIDRMNYDGAYSAGSYCGATVLNDLYILTAAHCIYGDTEAQLFTAVVPKLQNETDFPSSIVEKAYIEEVYYPSTYNNTTIKDDIAILKLASSLTTASNADFVIRPNSGDDVTYRNASENFYAVGHGNTSTGFDTATSLQAAKLTYVTNNLCNYSVATDTNLCMEGAVPTNKVLEKATCNGDSGGPLYWYDGGQYIQVGITSFGPSTGCGDPDSGIGATSVFTELHDYKVWIDSVIAGNETPKYIATASKKQSYLDSLNTSSGNSGNSSKSSDSGGSVPLWASALIFATALVRRYKK